MKSWYLSKTIWANVILMAASCLAVVQGNEWVAEYPGVVSGIGVAIGFLNVILRSFTSQKITK